MASSSINERPRESIEEKRKKCLLGELPDDFLRVNTMAPSTVQSVMYQQYPSMPPAQYVATQQLEMTIVQARLAKNYGITRMDPYCKVRVGHKTYETITAFNGSKNPYWNKKLYCPIPKGIDSIHVSIFDEKTMSADEEIAFALIKLPSEIFTGNVVDNWYPLSGRQGDNQEGQINIVLSFKEVPMIQPMMYNIPVRTSMPTGYNIIGQQPQHPIQPQSVRVAPVITEADVDQLHEMFPTIEKVAIKSVLEAQAGNKEASISALLTLGEDNKPE